MTALGSLLVAMALAILTPSVEGAGLPSLIGWVAVAVLSLGVVAGESTAVLAAAVIFVVKLTMTSALSGPLVPPVWIQALLIVLTVELAVFSLERRTRPRLNLIAFARMAFSALTALSVALVLEAAVYGVSGGGSLLRIAAVAAVVLLVGWVTWLWRRAVSPPP